MPRLPPPTTRIDFSLPHWAVELTRGIDCLPERSERVALAIELARRNVHEKSGGPFGAAVFECDSGRLLSVGVNLVTSTGLSILHAEMVALSLAQRRLGSYDLAAEGFPDCELVTSVEPCAMCFGALPWAGVRRLVCAARSSDAIAIGFDEGAKPPAWIAALKQRGIEVVRDVEREAAIEVLQSYVEGGGPIYNPL